VTRYVMVTGTSTEVGKTITTAALAATTPGRVAVVKPVQTGVGPDELGDADVVHRLAGVPVYEFVRLRDPLAPDTAARREGVELPSVSDHADRIVELGETYDTVIVEGAGGVLVHLDGAGKTLLDLGNDLPMDDVEWIVVCAPGLGTLNHTELTLKAIEEWGLVARLVLGSWPAAPGLAETCNRIDLARLERLYAIIPEGAGALPPEQFRARAPQWF